MPVPPPWALPDLPAAARWSVAVRDAGTGALLAAQQPDQLQLTASLGKIFLLVEVAARLAEGSLAPDGHARRRAAAAGRRRGLRVREGRLVRRCRGSSPAGV